MKLILTLLVTLTLGIVPAPQKEVVGEGEFVVSSTVVKVDRKFDAKTFAAAKDFAGALAVTSDSKIKARRFLFCAPKGIVFDYDKTLAEEQYTISISGKKVLVRASSRYGVLYAVQTLRQLLPAAVYGNKAATDEAWVLPCCEIEDQPAFSYRGMHFDCSRHFFTIDEVKRYLDMMAVYKLNRFHWHLTDDQGWRPEIKKYPLLTEVGAWRDGTLIGLDNESGNYDGIRHGGFYTQEEMREVVRYADSLGITIIPEVDLPGHMLAAVTSYPELGCTGGPYAVWQRWGVSDDVLCVGKESTFTFIEDVLTELCDIFPGEYFHIGGDECPKGEWEKCPTCQAKIEELGLKDTEFGTKEQYLQNYVTARVQKFLETKGKKIIGWDEITEGELAPGATVMFWRDWIKPEESMAKYAAQGFDLIYTPAGTLYFSRWHPGDEGREDWECLFLEDIYKVDPFKGVAEENRDKVIGVQANIWTEFIPTNERLETMLLPRLLVLSELQWTAPEARPDFAAFLEELHTHQYRIFDTKGYSYWAY